MAEENKRRFFRVTARYPMKGRLSVQDEDGKQHDYDCVVLDIGPIGVRVLLQQEIPVDTPVKVFVTDELLVEDVHIDGVVRRTADALGGHGTQLGIEFVIEEPLLSHMVWIMNQLAIQIRKRYMRESDIGQGTSQTVGETENTLQKPVPELDHDDPNFLEKVLQYLLPHHDE